MSAKVKVDATELQEELRSREEEITAQKDRLKRQSAEITRLQAELKHSQFVLNEKIEKLHTLIDVSRRLNSTMDVQELLTSLMSSAMHVMRAKDSSLLLLDEETNELIFNVALGEKGDRLQEFRVKVGQGIAGEVAASGEPIVVADVRQDDRWDASFDARTGFETRSIMAVPIKVRDEVIGVIEVLNAGFSGSLTDEDLDVFNAFSAQAAIAIENARIYEVLQTAIAQVGQLVGVGVLMTDWTGKLQLLSDNARELLGLAADDAVAMRTLRQADIQPNIGRLVADVLESGAPTTTQVQRGDGTALEVNCAALVDYLGKKLGVIAVLTSGGAGGAA